VTLDGQLVPALRLPHGFGRQCSASIYSSTVMSATANGYNGWIAFTADVQSFAGWAAAWHPPHVPPSPPPCPPWRPGCTPYRMTSSSTAGTPYAQYILCQRSCMSCWSWFPEQPQPSQLPFVTSLPTVCPLAPTPAACLMFLQMFHEIDYTCPPCLHIPLPLQRAGPPGSVLHLHR
jgi:hypothetical protein